MSGKPRQIVAIITLALLVSGCGLLSEVLPTDDAGVQEPPPTEAEVAELLTVLETCRAEAPTIAGIVWLNTGVVSADVAGLEDFLVRAPLVTDQQYFDEDETYRQFTEYYADEPEILDLVEPENLPTSFEVGLVEGADIAPLIDEIERFNVVESVELKPNDIACLAEAEAMKAACDQPPQGFLVWMSPGVGDAEVAAVSKALGSSALVEGFRYVGIEESYDEFLSFYGDESEVIELVDPDQLPTSFKIDFVPLDEPADTRIEALEAFREELKFLGGVDDIEAGPFQLFAICQGAELSETDRGAAITGGG